MNSLTGGALVDGQYGRSIAKPVLSRLLVHEGTGILRAVHARDALVAAVRGRQITARDLVRPAPERATTDVVSRAVEQLRERRACLSRVVNVMRDRLPLPTDRSFRIHRRPVGSVRRGAPAVCVDGEEPLASGEPQIRPLVGLGTIAREWGRIGCLGFGGPPTHIAMLRQLCVERRGWIDSDEFEHGIAATNLLPGPASTQLAIWRAWRLRGTAGALVGGVCFIVPGLVLIAAGLIEIAVRTAGRPCEREGRSAAWPLLVALPPATGGLAALTWVAVNVGALSYDGGFVIIPLMRADAVDRYHWMTDGQFLNAVALGQITPGAVVQTVAVVGYAAAGLTGGLLAAAAAFAPSFAMVIAGGPRFDSLRANASVQAFPTGAGPAVIGAIAGSALPLGLALGHLWQAGFLALATLALFAAKRGVVFTLLGAGVLGVVAAALG
ncbi:chromate transporter [Streptomyces sp. NPDC004520]|uniref:chromate transporter n=1 Tax=Streptomyces sp. NPDC004520 TaxID=3364702 RepID=UPI0036CD3114